MLAQAIKSTLDRPQDHPQRARDAADELVLQRAHGRAESNGHHRVARHCVARPDLKHALDVVARRFRRHVGPQSRKYGIPELATGRRQRRVDAHGEDHVVPRRQVEETEIRRHDADHSRGRCKRRTAGVSRRLERELSAEHRFVAAEPLPKRMRENDRRGTLGGRRVLAFAEPTSARRLHAERLKRAVRDEERAHAPRLAAVGERRGARLPDADLGECPVLVSISEVHRRRGRHIAAIADLPDPHELVRIRIRQWLDQHGVDDAEDRGRRADADCERDDGRECECRPPRQAAHRIAQIAGDGIEETDDAHAVVPPASQSEKRANEPER